LQLAVEAFFDPLREIDGRLGDLAIPMLAHCRHNLSGTTSRSRTHNLFSHLRFRVGPLG